MSGPARAPLTFATGVARPLARACWSLPVGAALGGAAYPPGVLLLRPEALAETQGSLGKADHQRPVGLQAVKVGRRVQTSRAGPAELEVLVNRKASAVETGALGKGGFGGENTRFGEGGAQAGGGGGGGLYGGGGGGEGGSGWGERAESGGGGGGSSLMSPGGTLGIDTTGVPMIQITVPTPVKEESKKEEPIKEESKKEESPAKTSSTSPTTLTQPIVSALIPTTAPS